jgi:hypothetical protein
MFLCLDRILLWQLETKFNLSSMNRLERSFISILALLWELKEIGLT